LLLTEVGRALLPCYLPSAEEPSNKAVTVARVVSALRHMAERPVWKSMEGELWWWGTLVKRYRNDAAYQRRVLDKFQATSWATCIENPLPSRGAIGGKRHLTYTIENLNRSQHPLRIRFRTTGASVIVWERNI
jgi:hypothetical protein